MEDTSTAVATPAAASSSSTSPASPQTTSTQSTPSPTTDRPSFKDALTVFNEAAKQQGRKPRGQTREANAITTAGEPAATVPDGSQTASPETQAQTPQKGPIPFDVHETSIKNARTKGAQEAEARFRQQFGDPQSLTEITQWARRAATDRVGFLRDVITEALHDPQLAPQVMSLAGQTMRGRQTAPASSEAPSVFTKGPDGQMYYDPSKQEARDAWLIERAVAQMEGRVTPIEETLQEQQAREQAVRAQHLQAQWRDRTLSEVRALPLFSEHEAEIKAAYAAMPPTSGHPAEEANALYRAYLQVTNPKRDAAAEQRVVAKLRSQAGASTLNPAATGAPTGIPKSVRAKDGGSMKAALEWAQSQTATR